VTAAGARYPVLPVRESWFRAPVELRRRVADALGMDEVDALDVRGGMSPGPAGILVLADRSTVFVKAVSADVNPQSHELYQWEAAILARLPPTVPAPRLLRVVRVDSWIALITSRAPGQTAGPPWTSPAVHAVVAACDRVANHTAPDGAPPAVQRLPDLDGWTRLADGTSGALDEWETRHVADLAAAAHGWREWAAGKSLTHLDLRADNALVDRDCATATLVDWGYGSAGAPWLDRSLLAADVVATGHADGPDAAVSEALAVLADCPPVASRFVIAQAGMWRRNSTLPPHAGMPYHRAWQRARARALRPLLSSLLALLGGPRGK
jgi:hypothetical protein